MSRGVTGAFDPPRERRRRRRRRRRKRRKRRKKRRRRRRRRKRRKRRKRRRRRRKWHRGRVGDGERPYKTTCWMVTRLLEDEAVLSENCI